MWGSILGGVISAGASLLGGSADRAATANLNKTNRRWQANEQRRGENRAERRQIASEKRETKRFRKFTDPAFMRKRAEKAGFNPLLFTGQAAGYGGIGGGGTSYNQGAPAFSSYGSSGIGAAGRALGAGFASQDEANMRAEELEMTRSALEMENMRLQEVADNSRFQSNRSGHLIDGGEKGTSVAEILNPAWSPEEASRNEIWQGGGPENMSIHQRNLPGDPGEGREQWNTAHPGMGQKLEDDYGELGGSIMSLGYLASDTYHNLHGDVFNPVSRDWENGDHWTRLGRGVPEFGPDPQMTPTNQQFPPLKREAPKGPDQPGYQYDANPYMAGVQAFFEEY